MAIVGITPPTSHTYIQTQFHAHLNGIKDTKGMAVPALRALLRQQIMQLARLTVGKISPAAVLHAQLSAAYVDLQPIRLKGS